MGDEQKRRSHVHHEPVHIAQALESLLNLVDQQCRSSDDPTDRGAILPLSTGRLYLDRLLGGGIRPATVTLFEADTAEVARPLLIDIARHARHRTLMAVHRLHWETALIWSAAARVEHQRFARGSLDDHDWAELTAAIAELADRDLWVTETIAHSALRDGITRHGVEVLLVDDVSRLAHPTRALAWLVGIAVELGVAVVATSTNLALDELRGGDRLVRVGVYDESGRATLVRADPIDMVRVEDVFVQASTGLVN